MKSSAAKICVPVCVERPSELAGAVAHAAEVADIIELRLDCLNHNDLDATRHWVQEYVKQVDVPVILTLRAADQGGHISRDGEARHRFWSSVEDLPDNCFADIELDLVREFASEDPAGKLPMDQHHLFSPRFPQHS